MKIHRYYLFAIMAIIEET